jgi:hypothetical protein
MRMGAELDIYVESLATYDAVRGYAIKTLLPHLTEAGIAYRILDRPEKSGAARKALLHLDLTELPDSYRDLAAQYDGAINGGALSIHRFLYSTLRLSEGDAHGGAVVVKTVLNARGLPEVRLRRSRNRWTRMRYLLGKLLVPGFRERAAPHYRVYRSVGEVPKKVWRDARLMVEKYAFDSLEMPIVKHRYLFMLGAQLNIKQVYNDPLCSSAKIISSEAVGPPPQEVMAVRRQLKLDYGAIDYFIVEGRGVVVDANKTMGSSAAWMEQYQFRRDFNMQMANALIDFVRN